MSTEFAPPIREVIVFQPESFPLHRWDNCSPSAPPCRKVKQDVNADMLPKLPFRRSTQNNIHRDENLHGSLTSVGSDDSSPRCPGRSHSPTPLGRHNPPFLAPQAVGPCRRPPSRSHGYNHNRDHHNPSLDLHQIPLKPITFNGKKIEQGFAQVLQEVVMDRSSTVSGDGDGVNIVFCIRRPGCGQCREHGMQLAEMVQDQPHVTLTGVIKETAGLHSSIRDFYSNYFTFPLYLDEGWDLYHTIGNKKLSVFKLCARGPALEVRYAKKGIRNIPLGGDLFTQGGVLIFDKDGKLRFVYYESYGKPLDMEAIRWAIEEANKPMDVSK